jgi:N-acetylglucosamine kinase-like BadF-type ATPase
MILLADSGSTKTEWVLLQDGKPLAVVFTQGINPYFQDEHAIEQIIREELIPALRAHQLSPGLPVYYYGAGCSNEEKCAMVKRSILKHFEGAAVTVEHDLLAAARALCGTQKGIAAILGTGSNSCLFDGRNIVANNPSLGFLMGDEGSGGYIGKELLKMFVYNELDKDMRTDFIEAYHLDKEKILDEVYHRPNPNRYCASFMPFVAAHKEHHQVKELVKAAFHEFFKRHITKYEDYGHVPFHCVGSVAVIFREELEEAAKDFGVQVHRIIKNPMEGLIGFHLGNHPVS